MPLSHRSVAVWYTQLAQQLDAGLTFRAAVAAPSGGNTRTLGTQMAAAIDGGGTVDDALRLAEGVLPQADILTLSAAAESGRLPETLRNLALRHAQLGAAQLKVALACAYPLAIAHVGLLLLPITRMIDWEKGFQWDPMRYARDVALLIVPLWLGIALLVVLARRHSPTLRAIAAVLPATGGYLRAQSLAELCFALGNFLSAGVPIGEAWAVAALITRSPKLKAAAEAMSAAVAQGQAPGQLLLQWPCFPPEFTAQYCTGEATGQLDTTLLRMSGQYQETANRALTIATLLYPAVVFALVAGAVVYSVLTLYAGYLKMVTKMAE